MRLWRLSIERGVVRWLGPIRTYTLLPRWRVEDRSNW